MTKQIIFIFALLCTLQAQASVQPVQKDTVRHTIHYEVAELLQPMQPVYLNGVLLPASRTGNWFVSISGGATVFLGTPLGCEDLFGRVKPSYSLAVGKWFTPLVGARVNYSGLQFKDAQLSTQDYHYIHADLLWNLLGRRYARQEQVRWRLAPFMGVGLLHNATNGNNPFALSYGILTQYRISKRVSAMLELSNTTTFQDFDGYGYPNRLGDHMLSLTAGFTFHLGKVGWKRAVDTAPYIHRNELLVDYGNFLSEENRRYVGRHNQDKRTLVELKKILEIEGLLDTYSHIFDNDDITGCRYPINNYASIWNASRTGVTDTPSSCAVASSVSTSPWPICLDMIAFRREDATRSLAGSSVIGFSPNMSLSFLFEVLPPESGNIPSKLLLSHCPAETLLLLKELFGSLWSRLPAGPRNQYKYLSWFPESSEENHWPPSG